MKEEKPIEDLMTPEERAEWRKWESEYENDKKQASFERTLDRCTGEDIIKAPFELAEQAVRKANTAAWQHREELNYWKDLEELHRVENADLREEVGAYRFWLRRVTFILCACFWGFVIFWATR